MSQPSHLPQAAAQSSTLPQVAGKREFVNKKAFAMIYKFDGDYKIDGRPLLLTVDPVDSQRSFLATGLRVWDGGIVLAKYLEHYVQKASRADPGQRGRLRGLELGCGTGVGGLALALLGHEAVLSDIGDLQAAATQSNIDRNRPQTAAAGGEASYVTLDWRSLPERGPLGAFDLVVAADVVWHESLVEPFLQAVSWACSGPGSPEVILSHKVRDEESVRLWERLAAEAGLRIDRKVPTEQAIGEDGHPDVVMYHLRKAG